MKKDIEDLKVKKKKKEKEKEIMHKGYALQDYQSNYIIAKYN